ncbi:FecCD family ABC transporter permease [Niallia sp. 01092]|uniref:FecCD family ABC transporter permease n=1 Tax=unclassified Niallia TaxID=2837522 RepID=UPI003FD0542D
MQNLLKTVHPIFIIVILFILLLLISIMNIGLGAVPISPSSVILALFGLGSDNESYIILHYRMPRIVLALFVGGGLAIAGAIAQTVLQNPLAAPDTLGISGGASVGAVSLFLLFPSLNIAYTGMAAFIGGLLAALAVYVIAYKNGLDLTRLALVGVSISAFCSAAVQLSLLAIKTNVQSSLLWLNGSLFGRTWEQVLFILPWVIVIVLFVLFLSKSLDLLLLGEQTAVGLGLRVEWMKILLLLSAVLLTGASIAAAGMIGFVGLISPHIARQLVGSKHIYSIPTSLLIGALMVLIADSLGRGLFPPIEIPAGLITSIIGAPYFLFLMWRHSKTRKA